MPQTKEDCSENKLIALPEAERCCQLQLKKVELLVDRMANFLDAMLSVSGYAGRQQVIEAFGFHDESVPTQSYLAPATLPTIVRTISTFRPVGALLPGLARWGSPSIGNIEIVVPIEAASDYEPLLQTAAAWARFVQKSCRTKIDENDCCGCLYPKALRQTKPRFRLFGKFRTRTRKSI